MNSFCSYELRTTDVDAARGFYSELLGARFWDDTVTVSELPARAAAAGAPPHWLGSIAVDDVAATALKLVQRGATQVGPLARTRPDVDATLLRDPFGAVVALTSAGPVPGASRVAWHLLAARDEALAFSLYAELFGWMSVQTLELDPEEGRHVTFTWNGSTEAVGSTSSLARLPQVHAQWLFFFPTPDLEESLARVRAGGGLTMPVAVTPEGSLVAACEDQQGAAFGLHQSTVR